jgi:thioredoxin reductase (NADPH)
MSRYLIDEIGGTPNIDIRRNTEVAGAGGDGRLETLTLRDNMTGATCSVTAAALFVLIGADPRTDWLRGVIQRDCRGFVLTGGDIVGTAVSDSWPLRPGTSTARSEPAGRLRRWRRARRLDQTGRGSGGRRIGRGDGVTRYLTKLRDADSRL